MELFIRVAIGVVAFGLGVVTMAVIAALQHPRSTAPLSALLPDIDRVAVALLLAIEASDPPSFSCLGKSLLDELGIDLIAPEEEAPFDPMLHVVRGTIRTADPTRHGTVADLLSSGLQTRAGRLIRSAAVKRYESAAFTSPASPDLGPPPVPPLDES